MMWMMRNREMREQRLGLDEDAFYVAFRERQIERMREGGREGERLGSYQTMKSPRRNMGEECC